MMQNSGVVIALGYIFGLLAIALPGGGFWLLLVGLVSAIIVRRIYVLARQSRRTRNGQLAKSQFSPLLVSKLPHPRIWLIAGLVGFLASFYLQWRTPQPSANDISNFVQSGNSSNQEQLFTVRGRVLSVPRMTRSQRGQFWLEANQIDQVKQDQNQGDASKVVTGKVYTTVPLLQSTGLVPGQEVRVTGVLYQPKAAANPGGFDLQKFLAQEGAFAGLSGRQVNLIDKERKWGWWRVREQIARSQVRWLGVPEGPIVSAMVLGSRAVDLPHDVRDVFVEVGLAHTLAASGFHTSLILGVVLGLTKRSRRGVQIFCGSVALLLFAVLTGFQPSVLRATLMGFAALLALGLGRKVKRLSGLMVVAVILLLVNPVWIWNLGFQLSFLATFGLIVTASAISRRMGWLPEAIASLISVPVAATIWTLPLLLHVFHTIAVYSIPLNVLATPLVSITSLGGIVSAIASMILPDLGAAVASFLYYPTHWLIGLAEFFAALPGNNWAVGSISTLQMVAIYILIILTWLFRWWQRRWLLTGFLVVALIFVPGWQTASNLFRVTVLAAGGEPAIVIQEKGWITAINGGDEGTGRFTLLPFLRHQGINRINTAVAVDFLGDGSNGWLEVVSRLPVGVFYDFVNNPENALNSAAIQQELRSRSDSQQRPNQGAYQQVSMGGQVQAGSATIRILNDQLPILQMQLQGKNWLLVGNTNNELEQIQKTTNLPRPQVLWCPNTALKELVLALQPEVAITTNADIDPKTLSELSQTQTKIFFTGRDGAIQWTPTESFQPFIQTTENRNSLL
ncbi:ComEC/Rec2 family competence protein [Calothrix sp. NIES-3974]|uniref:ComEC/Rec2 family competence protein n=1 Tax=Calothrix sp. NIES-3974 TaxID=2005462 RepID=UPI000B602CDA|nr:ComEC/Rec2 family competence protein [Calothrix sp. NIES-3974]BAZ04337.1 ComEC/Rec2-related protein [Calothrix sp. NIES-3974]